MPAPPSSPIDPAIGHLADLAEDAAEDPPGLLGMLARVAGPRYRRGVRHKLTVILGLAVCAVLAGARSFTAIAEWAADADQDTLRALGVNGAVPSESTFRRVLQRLDAEAFDELAGRWATQRTAPGPGARRVIAVDGKTLRGSGHGDQDSRHLLAAFDHACGVVLGQVDVDTKTNEIPMFTTLLDRGDIIDAVITADALHAQRAHAKYLHRRGAHYLLIVKRNQPGLHAQLAALPWRDVPVAYTKRERGHGRTERRTLKTTSVAAGLAFPRAAQAIRITRRRKVKGKWSAETCYAVTSLTVAQASPARLAAIIRGHWGIEDRLHWVRDMDFDEDRSQVRTASGPRTMASLRNLVITILRLAGTTSIAAALRYHARRPSRPLQTIMKVLNDFAGALRVVPLAINLKPSEIQQPLGQFQTKEATKSGILDVLRSLNKLSANQVPDIAVACDLWWPRFEPALKRAAAAGDEESAPDQHALLEEIYRIVKERLDKASESAPAGRERERTQVARRAERIASFIRGARILLVNDVPREMSHVVSLLQSLELSVTTTISTDDALAELHGPAFDVVISDMRRNADDGAGITLLQSMRVSRITTPVIFTVGRYQPERGVPGGAFGITNRVDELLNLVFDVLERTRG